METPSDQPEIPILISPADKGMLLRDGDRVNVLVSEGLLPRTGEEVPRYFVVAADTEHPGYHIIQERDANWDELEEGGLEFRRRDDKPVTSLTFWEYDFIKGKDNLKRMAFVTGALTAAVAAGRIALHVKNRNRKQEK